MAETLTGQSAPPLAQTPAQPQPLQTPTTPQEVIPEKFQGKSVGEVAKAYQDVETERGRQAQEIGELRNLLTAQQQLIEMAQRPAGGGQPTTYPARPGTVPSPEDEEKQFFEKPIDTMNRKIAEQVNQAVSNMQVSQAATMANFAEKQAQQESPELFAQDYGKKTKDFLVSAVRSRMINPALVTDPETWKSVAWMLRGNATKYSPTGTVNPVSPTSTERPGGYGTQGFESPVEMPSDFESNVKKWEEAAGIKFDRERLKKSIADGIKAKGGRQ